MSFNTLFIIGIIAIALVTGVIVVLLNLIFRYLEKRISEALKIKPDKVSAETPEANSTKKWILTVLTAFLAICIGLMEFVFVMGDTILNPGFVTDELRKLDVSAVTMEVLGKQSSGQPYGTESIQETFSELWPLLGEQTSSAIYSSYNYFLGNEPGLEVVIPMGSLQESLKKNLEEEILKSPPLELEKASPEQIQSYVDNTYQQLFGYIPDELKLSLTTSTADVVTHLDEIRRVVGFFILLPKILLPLILLMIAVIILVYRDVKIATRTLGITLVVAGILNSIYAFMAKEAGIRLIDFAFLPSFDLWMMQLFTDFLTIVKQFTPILLAIGGVLLTISFFWKSHKETDCIPVYYNDNGDREIPQGSKKAENPAKT